MPSKYTVEFSSSILFCLQCSSVFMLVPFLLKLPDDEKWAWNWTKMNFSAENHDKYKKESETCFLLQVYKWFLKGARLSQMAARFSTKLKRVSDRIETIPKYIMAGWNIIIWVFLHGSQLNKLPHMYFVVAGLNKRQWFAFVKRSFGVPFQYVVKSYTF